MSGARAAAGQRKGAIFLDRDGVINRPPVKRYVTRWDEFRFLPGTLRALRRLEGDGRKVVILSNQAGVGRGLMPRSQLELITRRMLAAIRRAGGGVDAVYYCPHAPDAGCGCRKPKTGLLRRACRQHRIDPKRSFVVGDSAKDVAMGRAAGCRTVLVLSGVSTRRDARAMESRPDRVARDLPEAIRWILGPAKKGRSSKGRPDTRDLYRPPQKVSGTPVRVR